MILTGRNERDPPPQPGTSEGFPPSLQQSQRGKITASGYQHCCMEAQADCYRLDCICGLKRFEHLPRRRPVNTSAIFCPQHRKARISAQMQEDDARKTRR